MKVPEDCRPFESVNLEKEANYGQIILQQPKILHGGW